MQIDPWRISTITYLELAQGCRSKDELQRIKRELVVQHAQVLPLTTATSELAMTLIDAHALADGLQLADALIAATALEHNLVLLTGNTRHFLAIDALKLARFEP